MWTQYNGMILSTVTANPPWSSQLPATILVVSNIFYNKNLRISRMSSKQFFIVVCVIGKRCDSSCFNGSCWAPGPQNCQTCKLLFGRLLTFSLQQKDETTLQICFTASAIIWTCKRLWVTCYNRSLHWLCPVLISDKAELCTAVL